MLWIEGTTGKPPSFVLAFQLVLLVAALTSRAGAVELDVLDPKWELPTAGPNRTVAVKSAPEPEKPPPGPVLPKAGTLIPTEGLITEVTWMGSLLPFVHRNLGLAVSRCQKHAV